MNWNPSPIAAVANALSSEHRVKLVFALLEAPATTGDLVAKLGLPQPRVSSHLAILRAAGIVSATAIGRRRIYRIDGRRTRRLVEEVAALADVSYKLERYRAGNSQRAMPEARIRMARTCYDHLAGIAGVLLLDRMVDAGWIEELTGRGRPHYELTPAGESALKERGMDVSKSVGRTSIGCPDGTEGGYHLGGELGAAVLRSLFRAGVVRQTGTIKQLSFEAPIEKWID